MGSGASVPEILDETKAKELAGNLWNQEIFDAKKDIEGNITKAQFEEQVNIKAGTTSIKLAKNLPASLDEVDADFIMNALKSKGYIEEDTRIVSFEKIKFGREKGYLGDKCLLKDIVYESIAPKAPTSIFVKMFPTDLVIPLEAAMSMWKVEFDFLTRTVKELPDLNDFQVQVPTLYFAEYEQMEDATLPPRFVLLMEPIIAKPVDILTSMPIEHAFRAVRDLANLHAPYWGWSHLRYRQLKTFECYGHLEDPGKKQQIPGMFNMGSTMGLQVFGADGPLSVEQQKDFSGYIEFWSYFGQEIWSLLQKRWSAVMDRWASIPTALIHGDMHVENMFCMEDGSNVYIDFQAIKLDAGVRDVAWLITSSLKSEERREYEEAIVKAYHEVLLARGVDYTWENCWNDYIFMKIDGLWRGMLGAGIFAVKNFKEEAGIFAPEPSEDSILERRRNCAVFSQVVDDMKHSNWPNILKALPVDDDDNEQL